MYMILIKNFHQHTKEGAAAQKTSVEGLEFLRVLPPAALTFICLNLRYFLTHAPPRAQGLFGLSSVAERFCVTSSFSNTTVVASVRIHLQMRLETIRSTRLLFGRTSRETPCAKQQHLRERTRLTPHFDALYSTRHSCVGGSRRSGYIVQRMNNNLRGTMRSVRFNSMMPVMLLTSIQSLSFVMLLNIQKSCRVPAGLFDLFAASPGWEAPVRSPRSSLRPTPKG